MKQRTLQELLGEGAAGSGFGRRIGRVCMTRRCVFTAVDMASHYPNLDWFREAPERSCSQAMLESPGYRRHDKQEKRKLLVLFVFGESVSC